MNQGNVPGPLNGLGQLPLMLGTGPCHPAGNDLALVSNESPQDPNVLIIYPSNFVLAEFADLTTAHKSHISASFSLFHATGPGRDQVRVSP
jgi:hypothetical protein